MTDTATPSKQVRWQHKQHAAGRCRQCARKRDSHRVLCLWCRAKRRRMYQASKETA